jgi:MoaA/NifB/PqqE/SkfB family radical SAM enzyme
MNITQKATRTAIGAGIDLGLNHAKKNPKEGISDILNVLGKFYKPTEKDKELSGGNAFSGMIRYVDDPESKWGPYANNILKNINQHQIKTLLLNLAYEAGYKGLAKVRETSEKYDCNVPWTILFDPTSACNMHCKGCWSGEYGHKDNLSFEEMDSIVTQGKELGTHFYLMTGGEPLVRKAEILKLAKKHSDCVFHAFTNGTLVDEAFATEMEKLGNIILGISLEGFEEQNDFRRGTDSFNNVMKAMDILKAHKLVFGLSICWTKYNCETVLSDEFLDLVEQKGALYAWYFHFMPVGEKTTNELVPSPEQRRTFIKRLREVRSSKNRHQIFPIDFQNDAEFVGGCIAGGKHFLHINPLGDVEPCVFIHYSTANIKRDTLLEALQQPLFMQYRRRQPFNSNMLRPCPMLENPENLPDMVEKAGAKSTDFTDPESAKHLTDKNVEYAKAWAPVADEIWAEMQAEKKAKKQNKEDEKKAVNA